MDVRLSDEQQDLQAMVRRLVQVSVETKSPSQHSLTEVSAESIWTSLSEAGLLALRQPNALGDMEATAVEVALVAEQLAIGGAYVPFIGQGVLAPALLSIAGAEEEARAVGVGELRCAVQLSTDLTGWGQPDQAGVAMDVSDADLLLTVGEDGALRIHRLKGQLLRQLDLTRLAVASSPMHGAAIGVRLLGEADLVRLFALSLSALAADLVGLGQRALDLTVGYVKERRQFEVSVGSFQAIQHLLADAATLVESARSCMWHAAWSVDGLGGDEALLAARQAKIFCGRAARDVVEIAIQCHGGIGVTWEHPLHVLLRRVLTDNQLFGGPERHIEAVASLRLSPSPPRGQSRNQASGESVATMGLDFADSRKEQEFRARLREWLDGCSLLSGQTGGVDEAPARTHQWRELLASAGWVGLTFPKSYGGGGLSPIYEAILNDELGEAGAPPAPPINHITNAIRLFGSEEQKQEYLPGLLSCKVRWCQGFSEPDAGSDLAALTTRGVLTSRDGQFSYRVTGQKIWTSDAVWAHWCLLLLRTEFDVPRHRGLSMLMVPMETPGIEVRPIVTAYGSQEFAEVFFEDVVIDSDHLLGKPGQGWEIAMALLGFERGPSDMGWTARLHRELTQIEATVRTGDEEASPAQRAALAEAWVGVEALRIHVQRSTSARLDGSAPGPEGSIDKLLMTKVDQQLNHVIVDILGPEAVLDEAVAFPGYIWSRAQSIFGGTQQVQRNIVAQRVLGLPSK